MKTIKLSIAIMAAVLLSLGLSATASAFHNGGVAHCDGCHTMHNSENGESIIEGGEVGVTGDFLTKGSDPSSTCLVCHASETGGSYHVLSPDGSNMTPGGDFYWLTKTFSYDVRGTTVSRHGYSFGHTIHAADFPELPLEDPNFANKPAPGGTFPARLLACSSCHDPHGVKADKTGGPISKSGSYGEIPPTGTSRGNYRLLGDIGYHPGGDSSGVIFSYPPPIARTTRIAPQPEADDNHTDYGKGMSEWCANCHTGFLAPGGFGQHKHPASNTSRLGGNISGNYNSYVKTGDFLGDPATSYLALVPFERQISDPTLLSPTSTQGPDSNSNVMCLSCHRAHASAFPNAGRWDFETELLVNSHPAPTDGGVTGNDVLYSYYNRDIATAFNPEQRSLCNKCHVKD
jgi:cytochrome c553